METMIKIDNGVSKKAMEEVAEVVTTLFVAANHNEVSSDNLGIALKLLGKTIKSGNVSISGCNLSTTLERVEEDTKAIALDPCNKKEESELPGRSEVWRKVALLEDLARRQGVILKDYPLEERIEIQNINALRHHTYEHIAYVKDVELHLLLADPGTLEERTSHGVTLSDKVVRLRALSHLQGFIFTSDNTKVIMEKGTVQAVVSIDKISDTDIADLAKWIPETD